MFLRGGLGCGCEAMLQVNKLPPADLQGAGGAPAGHTVVSQTLPGDLQSLRVGVWPRCRPTEAPPMGQGGGWGCGGLVTGRADMTAGGDFLGGQARAMGLGDFVMRGGSDLVCLHRLSHYQVDSAGERGSSFCQSSGGK